MVAVAWWTTSNSTVRPSSLHPYITLSINHFFMVFMVVGQTISPRVTELSFSLTWLVLLTSTQSLRPSAPHTLCRPTPVLQVFKHKLYLRYHSHLEILQIEFRLPSFSKISYPLPTFLLVKMTPCDNKTLILLELEEPTLSVMAFLRQNRVDMPSHDSQLSTGVSHLRISLVVLFQTRKHLILIGQGRLPR